MATKASKFTVGSEVIFTSGVQFRRFGLSVPKGSSGKVVANQGSLTIHPLVAGWKSYETIRFPMGTTKVQASA